MRDRGGNPDCTHCNPHGDRSLARSLAGRAWEEEVRAGHVWSRPNVPPTGRPHPQSTLSEILVCLCVCAEFRDTNTKAMVEQTPHPTQHWLRR